MKKITFGVIAPCFGPIAREPSRYQKIATEAERLEYKYLFVNNHFYMPSKMASIQTKPESVKQHTSLETWSLLAYIAGKTEKIMIGSCVTPLPLYNPVMLAKIVATIDNLSNGRVVFGVGAGYERLEFEAYGSWDTYRVRVSKTEEALTLIKRLWTEDIVNFEGKYYRTKNAILQPRPMQKPYPTIATGGMNVRMLQVAGQQADLWLPSTTSGAMPEVYEKAAPRILSIANDCNRKISLGLFGGITEEGSNPPNMIGSMRDCVSQLERYSSLGCEIVILHFSPVEKYNELMGRFQREIAPSFN